VINEEGGRKGGKVRERGREGGGRGEARQASLEVGWKDERMRGKGNGMG